MAAIVAVAFYCAATSNGADAAGERPEVVVGVAIPSSGVKAGMGQAIRSAALSEIARINAAGGIEGASLRAAVEDDDCTAEGGARVAASFVAQRAALVLGHPCSNAAIAAARTYAGAGVWFVAIGAGHADLTVKRAGRTIFRLGGRDDGQAADTVAVMVTGFAGKRIAVVHDRTAYARTLAEGVARGLKAAGQTAIAVEGIVAGKLGYAALIKQLTSGRAEVLYFAGFPAELAVLKSDLKVAGLLISIIASDAAAGDFTLQPVQIPQTHSLDNRSHLYMARYSSSAETTRIFVLASLEAFKKAAGNLNTFNSTLEVDSNGDALAATFVPACIPIECR